MTTSRIVRGTKARVFVYVVAVIFITGVIACYKNTLSNLDDVNRSRERCQQDNEDLSTQLHGNFALASTFPGVSLYHICVLVISTYKQTLANSLEVEKAQHRTTVKDLESRLAEEKTKHEKTASKANLQLASLQQNYNLLQSQKEDLEQKCKENLEEQLTEINQLQATLKEVKEELKKVTSDRENIKVCLFAAAHCLFQCCFVLQTELTEVQALKDGLEQQIQGTQGDNAQWDTKINGLIKENSELKRMLEESKVSFLKMCAVTIFVFAFICFLKAAVID